MRRRIGAEAVARVIDRANAPRFDHGSRSAHRANATSEVPEIGRVTARSNGRSVVADGSLGIPQRDIDLAPSD